MNRRRLLMTMFTLLAVVALSLPGKLNAAPDLCADCEWSCAVDSWMLYERCLDDIGDSPTNQTTCYNAWGVNYYNACTATFCSALGCSIKKKAPRSFPGST